MSKHVNHTLPFLFSIIIIHSTHAPPPPLPPCSTRDPLAEISVCSHQHQHPCCCAATNTHKLPPWLTFSFSSGMNALQLQNLATLAAAAAAAQSSASPSTASALTSSTGSLGALASPGNRRLPSLHRHHPHSPASALEPSRHVTLFPRPPSSRLHPHPRT